MSCNCGAKATYNAKPKDNNHYDWCDDSAQNYGKPPKAMNVQQGGWNVPFAPPANTSVGAAQAFPQFPPPAIVRPKGLVVLVPRGALNAKCFCGKPMEFGLYDAGGWWTGSCSSQGCYDKTDYNFRLKKGNWCELDMSGSPRPGIAHWQIGQAPATLAQIGQTVQGQGVFGQGTAPMAQTIGGLAPGQHNCDGGHLNPTPAKVSVYYGPIGNAANWVGTTKYWCAGCCGVASMQTLLSKPGNSITAIP